MEWIDTHCHLDDDQFAGMLPEVVSRAAQAGLAAVVAVGTTASTSEQCVRLAANHALIYAAVGIQPNHCAEVVAGDWERITGLLAAPRVVAIGETGLDRYWDRAPFDLQQVYFDRQLRLSQERDLPFIVHMRDCDEDVLVMLRAARQRGPLRGVMHSFTGSEATAAECVELGLHISFAGMVTYRKSDLLRQIARGIPDDRILIETDAPYLSPHPFRGQRPNEPALIVHTAACLAAVRDISVDQFAAQTTANARRLFRLPG